MYRYVDKKTPILPDFEEFSLPFEGKLDRNNRWVTKAAFLPLDYIEDIYTKHFPSNTGSPAINSRVAFCTLYIKQELKLSDRECVQFIQENPYLQYFLGYSKYSIEKPFDASMLTHFRKRFCRKDLNKINEQMIANYESFKQQNESRCESTDSKDKDDNDPSSGSHNGKLIVDATCAPEDIKYPTDLDLLNEAREKTEKIIDKLHIPGEEKKPRTYRKIARKKYLLIAKDRKMRKKKLRRGIGEQLRFVKRNLGHIDKLINKYGLEALSRKEHRWLLVIYELYRQQQQMFLTQSHSIENRIISISKPHVRPIIRGKAKGQVEFGSKLTISYVAGYSYLDYLSWENFNEARFLPDQIESYKKRFGYYPKEIHADKIYRNRENRRLCKDLGIKLSGPPLGRPKNKIQEKDKMKEGDRNPVEGKFGEAKRRYGMNNIMGKLSQSSETMISMTFIVMNMSKIMREYYFVLIRKWIFFSKIKRKIIFGYC